MSKPITTPFTFQAQAGPIPLSQLDSDFSTAAAAINDFATYSNYLTDTSGAPNQITVTIPVGTTFSYSAGVKLEVLLGNTTTSTAVQINVNGLGNKAVQNIDGSVPAVGQLIAGMILQLQYNGTVFLLVGAASKPGSIAPFTATAGGNVTLPAPSSGASLTVNSLTGFGVLINAAAAADISWQINLLGVDSLWVGSNASGATNLIGALTGTDYIFTNQARPLTFGTSGLERVRIATGMIVGAPTGGDQGAGTLNATGLFVNSIQTNPVAVKVKAALTNRISTTTLSADPDLTFALPVAGTYKIEVVAPWSQNGSTTNGISCGLTCVGATVTSSVQSLQLAGSIGSLAAGATIPVLVTSASVGSTNIGGLTNIIQIEGIIVVSVPGTIALSWAQGASVATNTSLLAGATMIVTRIA